MSSSTKHGYGSLLSAFSRIHYSNVHDEVLPAAVVDWKRVWGARYFDEGATYAGVVKDETSQLHGALIPTKITEDLRQRERYHEIVEIDPRTVG